MKLEDVKSYANLAEYFCNQAMMIRGHANWHRSVRHYQKAVELTEKANMFADLYRKMVELSGKAQQEGGAK